MTSQVEGVPHAMRSLLDSSQLQEQWEISRLQGQAVLIKELT